MIVPTSTLIEDAFRCDAPISEGKEHSMCNVKLVCSGAHMTANDDSSDAAERYILYSACETRCWLIRDDRCGVAETG